MSAENANLKGAAQGQAASEANATPQNPVNQGTNSDAKNVQFNSADIGKREKTEFFVKIQGEEEKQKAAEKEAAKKAAAEKRVRDKQKAAAEKEAEFQKKEFERGQKEAATFMKHEQNKEKLRSRIQTVKNFLFGGWHKYALIALVIAILVPVAILGVRRMQSIREGEALSEEARVPDIVMDAANNSEKERDFINRYENASSYADKTAVYREYSDYYESLDYYNMSSQEATIKIVEYVNVISHTSGDREKQIQVLQKYEDIPKTIEQKNLYFSRLVSLCEATNNSECYEAALSEITFGEE